MRPSIDGDLSLSLAKSSVAELSGSPITSTLLPYLTRLVRIWARDELAGHTSVALFARYTLELLAYEAPAWLAFQAQRATQDEVRHDKLCFGRCNLRRISCLANQFSGFSVPKAMQVSSLFSKLLICS